MPDGPVGYAETAQHYLDVLRRRKWIVVGLPILATAAALGFSKTQSPLYTATTQVLVKRTSIVSSVTNTQDPALGDATRFLNTRSSIARSRDLATRVAAISGIRGLTADKLLSDSKVSVATDADVLNISVTQPKASNAVSVANIYGTQLAQYQTQLDTQTIDHAVVLLNRRASQLRARGAAASVAYASLIQYLGQLETLGTLLANDTKVLQPAEKAQRVRPRPVRNGLLGAIFGGVLGIGLAFLAEALDRKVRSEQEAEDVLAVPLLGRIPKPYVASRKQQSAVLVDPRSADAETFRKLRTSIEFVALDGTPRRLMITSAVQKEGKSTTAANLAVAYARAGRRVVLVDLDLRRPVLHRLFRVSSFPGATDVVVGRSDLTRAIRSLTVGDSGPTVKAAQNGRARARTQNGKQSVGATLDFLPAGTLPPSPAEFLQNARLGELLDELGEKYDLVIVDGPPLIAFGDAMSLSAHVDAIIPLVRVNIVERPTLRELARQLQNCRAPTLGFVITGVGRADIYRYGYEAYAYEAERPSARDVERT